MIAEFSHLFAGQLQEVGERLSLSNGRSSLTPAAVLLDEQFMRDLLSTFARRYDEPEPRAVASQWSKQYFSHLLMPVLAINLVLGRALPIRIEQVALRLGEDGVPESFFLKDAGCTTTTADWSDRFGDLLDGHISPLIASTSKVSSLPHKVLWSNVGNIVENVIGFCAKTAGETAGVRHGRQMLESRSWPDGRRNLLFEPIRYRLIGGTAIRKRKTCCLRYLIPSLKLCGTCPLDGAPPTRTG